MFNGARTLSVSMGCIMLNPQIIGCHQLKKWYLNNKNGINYKKSCSYMPLHEAESSNQAMPFHFSVKAHIVEISQDKMWYQSCNKCPKKAMKIDETLWRCDGCSNDMQTPLLRYILSIHIDDGLNHKFVSAFDDVAISLLGKKCR
jgi:hypothetical protein